MLATPPTLATRQTLVPRTRRPTWTLTPRPTSHPTPDAEEDTTDPNGPISGGGLSGCATAPAGNGTAPLALGFLMVFGALIRRRRAA
jgi:MYXO-CTERM domain-containing protein